MCQKKVGKTIYPRVILAIPRSKDFWCCETQRIRRHLIRTDNHRTAKRIYKMEFGKRKIEEPAER